MQPNKFLTIFIATVSIVACSSEVETEDAAATEAQQGPEISAADAAFVTDTTEYLERLEQLGFAGNVHITRNGQVLLQAGYGMADREAEKPWSKDTISTVGSITKQFTGAAILLLVEDGLLSVDDPITDYFPDVPEDKQTIMLHQLLTHSSGIVDLEGYGDWDPIDRDTYIRHAMAQPLEFEPGSSFAYSNAGYSLLAAIIEQITGDSYEAFIRERLLIPAGMEDTGYILADWDDARLAAGYLGEERWGTVLERPLGEDGPYWVLRGNGGIHSTTADMIRWGQALIDGSVLSQRSIDELWFPHVDEGFGDSHYAYGWVVMQGPGEKRLITHNGGNGIQFADMAIYPDDNVIIVLQTNVLSAWPVAGVMLEYVTRRLFADEDYLATPDAVEVDKELLEAYAGQYSSGDGEVLLNFSVAREANELLLTAGNPHSFAYLHSSRTPDFERSKRLSGRIEKIVAAYVEDDDLWPLFEAYEGRATLDALEQGWSERKLGLEEELGALVGYAILGTALRDGRDVTVAQHIFENGSSNTAFVWDPEEEERLLGRSSRGLNPEIRYLPTGESEFGSWDGGFSDSRELSIADDGESLTLATSAGEIIATRDR